MDCECHAPDFEYLTRSDIARILQISTKQAGRLMDQMPSIYIGRTHRRVARADFEAWTVSQRERHSMQSRERIAPAVARYRATRAKPSKFNGGGVVSQAVRERIERRQRQDG